MGLTRLGMFLLFSFVNCESCLVSLSNLARIEWNENRCGVGNPSVRGAGAAESTALPVALFLVLPMY